MPEPQTSSREISATMVTDLLSCEQRLHLDLHGNDKDRDEVGAFVQMLWRGGLSHEAHVLSGYAATRGAVDLREVSWAERETATAAAMDGRATVILGGRIGHGDLVGMPDLIIATDAKDGYIAGDVKLGSAEEETPAGPRAKLGYGVQVAHYANILELGGRSNGRLAMVAGADGLPTVYDLHEARGRSGETLSGRHTALLADARAIRDGMQATRPAAASICKVCHWRSHCARELKKADDLTLVAELGRATRAILAPHAVTVAGLAGLDLSEVSDDHGRSKVAGLGLARLERFRDRARLLAHPQARAYAAAPLDLPPPGPELHLDLETDPLRGGLVYLHGVWVRDSRDSPADGHFLHFFAEGGGEEEKAFADAMAFLLGAPGVIVHWSPFERTSYRSLQARYPGVCTPEQVEGLFDRSRSIDLYADVVRPHTFWPAGDLGLKTIARLCGFGWRDTDPSGANSIEWFDRWTRERDEALRQRIIDYNEDDCRATAAVLDVLRTLPVAAFS